MPPCPRPRLLSHTTDPSTQVGACIVDPEQKIVGIGYNGFPRGCSDDDLPWARTADNELDTKCAS